MGKSYKKIALIKGGGWIKDIYWSIIRSRNKQELRQEKDISNPKEIINDYNYVDYTSRCKENDCYCMKNFGRRKCLNK